MRIQLWSYNYAPEPTGIGPVSATWAKAMTDLGHEVTVVAAHPHYPEPIWGRRLRPTRTRSEGVDVIRLPLWIGRDNALARMRQDASFSAALAAAFPLLPKADARVVVTPCFPALSTAIAASKIDKTPWMLWVQDILPDGAIDTGLLDADSLPARLSRKLELAAYDSADRIVVMNNGTIEQVGTPLEVYRDPKTLFVADFIGETNKFPAVIDANGGASLGDLTLHCRSHGLAPGSRATVMVRPNDIAPHSLADGRQAGAGENLIAVRIESMEFLGSFWRTHLRGEQIDRLVADFSINAERRLQLTEGMTLQVELPQNRMLVFP